LGIKSSPLPRSDFRVTQTGLCNVWFLKISKNLITRELLEINGRVRYQNVQLDILSLRYITYRGQFTLCKQKDIDWCNDDLNFNLIYNIEGYLFLYKSIDFWIYSDKTGIKSRRFNHFD
jgi:hypothetical protein